MIQQRTVLRVSDNSGAKQCICIGQYKNRKTSKIGDVILVSIRKMHKNLKASSLHAGKICKAIIIRTKQKYYRGGNVYQFMDNAVVLLDNQLKPFGNRIFGIILRLENVSLVSYQNIINMIEKTL